MHGVQSRWFFLDSAQGFPLPALLLWGFQLGGHRPGGGGTAPPQGGSRAARYVARTRRATLLAARLAVTQGAAMLQI
jgi:hypothetical protein